MRDLQWHGIDGRMKRWQVFTTTYYVLSPEAPVETIVSEHRFRWVASLNAFMYNTAPMLRILGVSIAEVRRKPPDLRLVK